MASSFREKSEYFLVEGYEKTLIGLSVDPLRSVVGHFTANHQVGLRGSGAKYLVSQNLSDTPSPISVVVFFGSKPEATTVPAQTMSALLESSISQNR